MDKRIKFYSHYTDLLAPKPKPSFRHLKQGIQECHSKYVYSHNTYLLPPKPKSYFRHLKQGIQEFHGKYVLVPAEKAAKTLLLFVGYTILLL